LANAEINVLDNAAKTKVEREISLINEELSASSPLIKLCKSRVPDFIEMRAMAQILHSFYNGVEKTIVLILRNINEKLPNDYMWHKTLLDIALGQNSRKFKIFRDDLRDMLEDYLAFRHFIRHSYSYQLKWERMSHLVENLEDTWMQIKLDFESFML
jgi:hypothetical protein